MLILVCGSRDWADRLWIVCALSQYIGQDVTVMHGAASRKDPVTGEEVSADMIADGVARVLGFKVRQFPADWERYGRRAGILRTAAMFDEAPGCVEAFQSNGSRGTQFGIDEAARRGIPITVHRPAPIQMEL